MTSRVSPVIVDSARTWAIRSAVPLPSLRVPRPAADAVGVDRGLVRDAR